MDCCANTYLGSLEAGYDVHAIVYPLGRPEMTPEARGPLAGLHTWVRTGRDYLRSEMLDPRDPTCDGIEMISGNPDMSGCPDIL